MRRGNHRDTAGAREGQSLKTGGEYSSRCLGVIKGNVDRLIGRGWGSAQSNADWDALLLKPVCEVTRDPIRAAVRLALQLGREVGAGSEHVQDSRPAAASMC